MTIRTILLLGKTGGGKSTLANTLVNQNGNFDEIFREGAGMTSETRQNQVREFEINLTEDGRERIRYVLIDTVGLCDTQLTAFIGHDANTTAKIHLPGSINKD